MDIIETHKNTLRSWFALETMPAAWRAAEPDSCAELARLLQNTILKAYHMGLLDGAAQHSAGHDTRIFESESILCECHTRLLESQYIMQNIYNEFVPLWRGDTMEPRKGEVFRMRMCTATGLVVDTIQRAMEHLHTAQDVLGLLDTNTDTNTNRESVSGVA